MADIPAQLVKQLREMTDAGMMDCKKALVETNGDLQKAVEYLREKGLSKAAKKADRVASEGVVSVEVASDFSKASMIEINSETDFVAKNDTFKELVDRTAKVVYENTLSCTQSLQSMSVEGVKFEEYLQQNIAKIGENIVVRRVTTLEAKGSGIVNGYVHSNGRVGVLIAMKYGRDSSKNACVELAKSICMHAAAMKPQVLSYTELDSEFIQKEKVAIIAELKKENEELQRLGKPLHKIPEYISRSELNESVLKAKEAQLREDLKAQGKPEQIWDKILPGQMERFIADSTLLDQRMTLLGQFYVMDDKKTIAQVLDSKSQELNDSIEIVEYVRFELGEGIEKKVEDFAAEVAAQMQ
ncbi:elongation factor Ts [Helicobacter cinaedi]|uniref:Elongation factor Ts n=1 Tax=Helicobacter cinaedi CCUG 18818 = ATCC BAA-847 TaxID=537971 RepID=A0AAI8QG51_9HELI|nr:translation elongation factor Ts [Helicobacter cinaedi]EFR46323.1 translation elongation factor Ts [Helicobacter cinaedi CCUG 18818 = ATCC BAA-847]QOQ90458.1 elongation factor Ts [Helicobacter cinaedi]BAM31364.1 elongation factor Ts [Helicobacter cinaedi CCUG 18818 = ATCC BAA-847]